MVGVLAAFVGLSMVGGPPPIKADTPHHVGIKDDAACLACHNWPAMGPSTKPLPAGHPPPRPKKPKPGQPPPEVAVFECLKCHAPK